MNGFSKYFEGKIFKEGHWFVEFLITSLSNNQLYSSHDHVVYGYPILEDTTHGHAI